MIEIEEVATIAIANLFNLYSSQKLGWQTLVFPTLLQELVFNSFLIIYCSSLKIKIHCFWDFLRRCYWDFSLTPFYESLFNLKFWIFYTVKKHICELAMSNLYIKLQFKLYHFKCESSAVFPFIFATTLPFYPNSGIN